MAGANAWADSLTHVPSRISPKNNFCTLTIAHTRPCLPVPLRTCELDSRLENEAPYTCRRILYRGHYIVKPQPDPTHSHRRLQARSSCHLLRLPKPGQRLTWGRRKGSDGVRE